MSLLAKDYFEVNNFINPCNDVEKEQFIISEDSSQPVNNQTTNVDVNVTSPRRRRRDRYWYNRNRYLFSDPSVVVVSDTADDDENSAKFELTDENIKMILGGIIIVLILFLIMRKNK